MLVCAKPCHIVSMLQIPVKTALAKKKDRNVSILGPLFSDSCKPLDEPLNVNRSFYEFPSCHKNLNYLTIATYNVLTLLAWGYRQQ